MAIRSDVFENGALKLDGDMLSLFDRAGFINKEYWVTNMPGTSIFMESPPFPPNIKHVPKDESDVFYVDSMTGVRMYLGGTLTKEMVPKARVNREKITFPKVSLNGGVCDVVVTP